MVKLDDYHWCARRIRGDACNRGEFLGQLVAYTHGLKVDDAMAWFDDGDPAA